MKKKKRSITIPQQLRKQCPACGHFFIHCLPYGDEALEKIKEFRLYQILESKLKGSTRERSISQLGLYWKCCTVVAELLSDHNNIFMKEDIDLEVKVKLGKKHTWLIKRFKIVSGVVYIEPLSIAFANLNVLSANRYFDMAFKELAHMAQMTVDELIVLAKSKMNNQTG